MDPLTLVIRTNNLGEIVQVFSDLPLTVVNVSGDPPTGGTLTHNGPLSSMPDKFRVAVGHILNPYDHLDHIQKDRISQVCINTLSEESTDGGFRRGMVSAYVEKMTLGEMLENISGEPEVLAQELGFNPETGVDVEPVDWVEPAEVKPPEPLNWGRGRTSKTWHVMLGEATRVYPNAIDRTKRTMYQGTTACGLKDAVIMPGPTAMDCQSQPEPSLGIAKICPECVKYRWAIAYPKEEQS